MALFEEWGKALKDPSTISALVQFGLNLSQPVGLGQNVIGHVGQAIGGAGEAAARSQSQEMAREEEASKVALRKKQGETADIRAQAALERSSHSKDLSAARLDVARMRAETSRYLGTLQRRIQAQRAYQNYVKQETDARLLDPSRPAPLSQSDFYSQSGFGDLLASAGSTLPHVSTQEEYDRLPSGSSYISPDGKQRTKQ